MENFFLLIEVLIFAFCIYIIIYKKEMAVVYLPVIFFVQSIINPVIPAFVYYGIISLLILFLIDKNIHFFRENPFALVLIVLLLILLTKSKDIISIRPSLFGVIWIFILIPLLTAIYRKYDKEVIFKELSNCALIILFLFCINVIASSLSNFSPKSMYGITSGILYGNLFATDFNILTIASFIVLLQLIKKFKLYHLLLFIISFSFIMLTLRRSVMILCLLGIVLIVLILIHQKQLKNVLIASIIAAFTGAIILINTGYLDVFVERYELRKLDERELEEEKRFEEYELLYNDMFIFYDYSPWFGFELFNSAGNYGKGVLGERSLHGDLTNIVHSTGFIGLILYALMIMHAFLKAIKRSTTKIEKYTVFFCLITFAFFTITGRYTQTGYMTLLFLLLMLPLSKKSTPIIKINKEEEEEAKHQFELMFHNV
jgi:hypothetical protein